MHTTMNGGGTAEPVILDAMELASNPELEARFAESAHQILADLVRGGADQSRRLPGARKAGRHHPRRPAVNTPYG